VSKKNQDENFIRILEASERENKGADLSCGGKQHVKETMRDDLEGVSKKSVLDVSLCPVNVTVAFAVTRADWLQKMTAVFRRIRKRKKEKMQRRARGAYRVVADLLGNGAKTEIGPAHFKGFSQNGVERCQ